MVNPRSLSSLVSAALVPGHSAHERQRELVRASLLACPPRSVRTPRTA